MQVIASASPKGRLVLWMAHEGDGEWLTVCHEGAVEGCLPTPIRYDDKVDAIAALNKLYPELSAKHKRVVPARSILPEHNGGEH